MSLSLEHIHSVKFDSFDNNSEEFRSYEHENFDVIKQLFHFNGFIAEGVM